MHVEAPLDMLGDIEARRLGRSAAVEVSQMVRVVERARVMFVEQHDGLVVHADAD